MGHPSMAENDGGGANDNLQFYSSAAKMFPSFLVELELDMTSLPTETKMVSEKQNTNR